jgi:hypothetical protein
VDVVRRAKMLGHCSMDERNRLYRSSDPVDQALRFLHRLNWGSASQIDALRRNPELDKALGNWMAKATRILERENRVEQRKIDQKQTTREKLRKLRKQ